MRRWRKYSEYRLAGDWHLHTNYTDGINTVIECAQAAVDYGLKFIAFTEHVRRELTYDFDLFLQDISIARERFNLVIAAGVETAVLDTAGTLNVSNEILEKVEFATFAFHARWFQTKEEYLSGLKNAILNPVTDLWGHPTRCLQGTHIVLERDEIDSLISLIVAQDIAVELNVRYKIPNGLLLERILSHQKIATVTASDAHCIEEILTQKELACIRNLLSNENFNRFWYPS